MSATPTPVGSVPTEGAEHIDRAKTPTFSSNNTIDRARSASPSLMLGDASKLQYKESDSANSTPSDSVMSDISMFSKFSSFKDVAEDDFSWTRGLKDSTLMGSTKDTFSEGDMGRKVKRESLPLPDKSARVSASRYLQNPSSSSSSMDPSSPQAEAHSRFHRNLSRLFHLPVDEKLLGHSICSIFRLVLVPGRIYITPNNICFFARLSNHVIKKVIPFLQIVSFEKRDTAIMVPDGIEIVTRHDKILFAGFENRDLMHQLLVAIRRQHPENVEPVVQPSAQATQANVDFSEMFSRAKDFTKTILLQKAAKPVYRTKMEPFSAFDKQVQDTFQLPSDQKVVFTTCCFLIRSVVERGMLVLTQSFICFLPITSIPLDQKKVSFLELQRLRKKEMCGYVPVGISIAKINSNEEIVFGYLYDRDECFRVMTKLFELSRKQDSGGDAYDSGSGTFSQTFSQTLSQTFSQTGQTNSANNQQKEQKAVEEQPETIYKKKFIETGEITAEEGLIEIHECSLIEKNVRHLGFLFISEAHLCFYAEFCGYEKKEIIVTPCITGIDKCVSLKSAIKIETIQKDYVVGDFGSLEIAFKSIQTALTKLKPGEEYDVPKPNTPGMKWVRLHGYDFQISNSFDEQTSRTKEESTKVRSQTYVTRDGSQELVVTIDVARSSSYLPESEVEIQILQTKAERLANSAFGEAYVKMAYSGVFVRKEASPVFSRLAKIHRNEVWTGWSTSSVSSSFGICSVVVCRRKLIPPFANKYQDAIFLHKITKQKVDFNSEIKPNEVVIMGAGSIIHSKPREYNTEYIQNMANCLVFSCSEYQSLEEMLKIRPSIYNEGTKFCKSIHNLLVRARCLQSVDLYSESGIPEDPLEIVKFLESHPLDDTNAWKARLVGYLYYLMQNTSSRINLIDVLIRAVTSEKKLSGYREGLVEIVEYMMYMRPVSVDSGQVESFVFGPLINKLNNAEIMKKFSLFEPFVSRVLNTPFFEILQNDLKNNDIYIGFICSILLNANGEQLVSNICNVISRLALEEEHKSKMIDLGIIEIIIPLLFAEDGIVVFNATKALINIYSQTDKMTVAQVGQLLLPAIQFRLLKEQSSPPIVHLLLILIRILCKTDEHRDLFIKYGLTQFCIKLFMTMSNFDKNDAKSLWVDVIATLWSLCSKESQKIITREGIVPVLSGILNSNEEELLLEKTIGCLIPLVVFNRFTSIELAESGCIQRLCMLLSSTRDLKLVKNILGLMIALSSVEANRRILMNERVLPVVISQARIAKSKNETFIITLAAKLVEICDK